MKRKHFLFTALAVFLTLQISVFTACGGGPSNDSGGYYYDYYTNYTISFNANGGEGTMQNITCSSYGNECSANLPISQFTRAGFRFLGWATSASAKEATYRDGSRISNISNDITLYAVWLDLSKPCIISFNANGGQGTMSSVSVNPSTSTKTKLPLATFTKEGYVVVGWAKTANATEVNYKDGAIIDIVGNMTLYAVWKEDTRTIATVDANGFLHIKLSESTSMAKTVGINLSVGTSDSGVQLYLMTTSQYNSFLSNKSSFTYATSALSCNAKVTRFIATEKLSSYVEWHYVIYNSTNKNQTVYYEITEDADVEKDKIFDGDLALDEGEYLQLKLEDSYDGKTFTVDLNADGDGVKAYLMTSSQLSSFETAIKNGSSFSFTESKLSINCKVKDFTATDKPSNSSAWYYVVYNPNASDSQIVTLKITATY